MKPIFSSFSSGNPRQGTRNRPSWWLRRWSSPRRRPPTAARRRNWGNTLRRCSTGRDSATQSWRNWKRTVSWKMNIWESDGKMMGTYVILENWWSLGFFSSPLMMDSGNLIIEILRDCDGNGWILNGIQGKNSGSGCVREWGIPYNSPKWSFHEDMMNNQME